MGRPPPVARAPGRGAIDPLTPCARGDYPVAVPLPTVLFLALLTGLSTALAGRIEIKNSPRPVLLTQASFAYLLFDVLVLVPASAYFYVAHGDWFLVYLGDVRAIPSALALVGFGVVAALGAGGFALGGWLLRSHRDAVALSLVGLVAVFGAGTTVALGERLGQVGSQAQYLGHFGLVPFREAPTFAGALAMGTLLAAGFVALLLRVRSGSRRAA